MDFRLTEKQKQTRALAKEYAQQYLAPGLIERDDKSEYSMEAFRQLGKLGLIGLPYGKEYGGLEGDDFQYVLAVEEISKVEAAMGNSFSACTSLFCGPLDMFGTEAQKKKFMPPVISGEKLGAFGITEAEAGSDSSKIKTIAKKQGDYYILNGTKCYTTNGPNAEYYVVIASTNPEKGVKGLSAFVMDMKSPGVKIGRIENKLGIRPVQVSEVIMKNVKIPQENLIGEEGQGFRIAMQALDYGRIGIAAQALGIAEGAYDIARDHLMKRKQFGKPLYQNQYLAFTMAELKMKIEQARFLLYNAVFDKEQGERYTISASMAKCTCSDVAMEVTTQAVQMLGGRGYTKDYHVERMMRDAKITQIYEGTNEIQKLIISGSIFS